MFSDLRAGVRRTPLFDRDTQLALASNWWRQRPNPVTSRFTENSIGDVGHGNTTLRVSGQGTGVPRHTHLELVQAALRQMLYVATKEAHVAFALRSRVAL